MSYHQRRRQQQAPFIKPELYRQTIRTWFEVHRAACEFASKQLTRFPGTNWINYYDFYMETNT